MRLHQWSDDSEYPRCEDCGYQYVPGPCYTVFRDCRVCEGMGHLQQQMCQDCEGTGCEVTTLIDEPECPGKGESD